MRCSRRAFCSASSETWRSYGSYPVDRRQGGGVMPTPYSEVHFIASAPLLSIANNRSLHMFGVGVHVPYPKGGASIRGVWTGGIQTTSAGLFQLWGEAAWRYS